MSHLVEWDAWSARWDAQQAGYLPDREQQFALMLTVVERVVGSPGRFVDLACGPGAISARAITRFPEAEVIGVDLDPFLLEMARQTVAGARFAAADLREPGWDDVLGEGPVDAVCSATALHYLAPTELAEVAQALARRIRPGGIFLNADTMLLGPSEVPRLDAIAVQLRDEIWSASHASGIEDWQGWWTAAGEEPAFADLLAQRAQLVINRPKSREITITDTLESFRKAGFTEVAVLGQVADKHLFAAIR